MELHLILFLLLIILGHSEDVITAPPPSSSSTSSSSIQIGTTIISQSNTDKEPLLWKTIPWLRDLSYYPKAYTYRNQVYNRPFRYRGRLNNVQDAYTLWFDCLQAERATPLENGPMLNKKGQAYCHRLGHRINKLQRVRLNPISTATATEFEIESVPVPTRDAFVEYYGTTSKPVVFEKLATVMLPGDQDQESASKRTTVASCISKHKTMQTFSLPTVCPEALINGGYLIPTFAAEDVIQTIRSTMKNKINEAKLTTPMWPIVWQTTAPDATENTEDGDGVSPSSTSIFSTSVPLSQTPSGAHLMLIAYKGEINVKMYSPFETKLYLKNTINENGIRTFHYNDAINDATATYKSVTVTAPDVLYIPSGYVYTFDAIQTIMDGGLVDKIDNQVVIITHGFVDASALNHFKDEIELEWNHVDATSAMLPRPPVARKLEASEDMEDNTDDTEDTGGFGMSILSTYSQTARLLSSMHGKDVPFAMAAKSVLSDASAAHSPVSWEQYTRQLSDDATESNTNGVQKKKGKNYRVWRRLKLFEKKMSSIIPATPILTNLVYVGAELVQMKVLLPYSSDSSFHSIHEGFVLHWSLMNSYTDVHNINATGSHHMKLKDHCWKESIDETAEATTTVPTTPVPTTYLCECKVLKPESSYALRLATWTTSTVGSSSIAVGIQTGSLSIPPTIQKPISCGIKMITYTDLKGDVRVTPELCISIQPPYNNGGRAITSLIYRWKRKGPRYSYMNTPWTFSVTEEEMKHVNGNSPIISKMLHNIIPNATIYVQVASKNSLGLSEWSEQVMFDTTIVQHNPDVKIMHYGSSVAPLFLDMNDITIDLLPRHIQSNIEQKKRRLHSDVNGTPDGTPVTSITLKDLDLSHPLGIISMETHLLQIVRRDGGTDLVTDQVVGWRLHHSSLTHDVSASIVIADPIDASEEYFYNSDEMKSKIVFIERGGRIPFRDKIQRAQLAGAVGVIIMDHTGKCTKDWHQGCVPGGAKHNGEGFAKEDKNYQWEGIDTPTLLITKEDGERIKKWIGSPLM